MKTGIRGQDLKSCKETNLKEELKNKIMEKRTNSETISLENYHKLFYKKNILLSMKIDKFLISLNILFY